MNKSQHEILFGKFEIIECFKKDEHTGVYLANHVYLQKKIILKVLNTVTIPDPVLIERFKREAKLLAKLNHPNIINVLDFGTHDDFFYISFEYFTGSSLRALLKKNKSSIEQKEYLLIQMLKGLHCAHEMGIIHRDIKPENIFINENYELKIGDFGLAFDMSDNFVTAQHAIVGTPCYMSPEQVEGHLITKQSDLFSLGIVAFELFSGTNPFLGKDINATINNIISFSEDSISEDLSALPEHLQKLISGLLKRNLSERIVSAKDALTYLNISEIAPPKFKPGTNSKVNVIAAALVTIIISTTIVLFIFIQDNTSKFQPTTNLPEVDSTDYTGRGHLGKSVKSNDTTLPETINKLTIVPSNRIESSTLTKEAKDYIKYGSLNIECFPWADVYIDSLKIDTTPLSDNLTLAEGMHEMVLKNPDFPEYRKQVRIFANAQTSIKINMDTLWGFVDFRIYPWGEVYIDNKLICQTPIQKPVRLIPGEYQAILKNPGALAEEVNFSIQQNDTLLITHNFEVK